MSSVNGLAQDAPDMYGIFARETLHNLHCGYCVHLSRFSYGLSVVGPPTNFFGCHGQKGGRQFLAMLFCKKSLLFP